MRRVFETERIWSIGPEAFRRAVDLIEASERDHRPELVVGIERGGRPLARVLAVRFRIPVATIRARHNADDRVRSQATGLVTVEAASLPNAPVGRRVLLVDDIAGSGATLRAVTGVVAALLCPSTVRTVTLCRNIGAAHAPNTWVWEVSDWVHFPWEAPVNTPTEPLPTPESVRHP